ncbi:MAG: hypothetical protein K0R51_2787 [Cytophagaceae bacterium]|jgi:hypothetical protein|nr:hypothetical protein [Cytophagaceae bacterium]
MVIIILNLTSLWDLSLFLIIILPGFCPAGTMPIEIDYNNAYIFYDQI